MVTLIVRQLLLIAVVSTLSTAFVINSPSSNSVCPSLTTKSGHGRSMTALAAAAAPENKNSNSNSNKNHPLHVNIGKALATTFLVTASLWSAPAVTSPVFPNQQAMAKEMASGSGARVNKDAESLLRYGLPINNKEVRCDSTTPLHLSENPLSARHSSFPLLALYCINSGPQTANPVGGYQDRCG